MQRRSGPDRGGLRQIVDGQGNPVPGVTIVSYSWTANFNDGGSPETFTFQGKDLDLNGAPLTTDSSGSFSFSSSDFTFGQSATQNVGREEEECEANQPECGQTIYYTYDFSFVKSMSVTLQVSLDGQTYTLTGANPPAQALQSKELDVDHWQQDNIFGMQVQ